MRQSNFISDLLLILVLGSLVGVATSYGQTYIPAPFTQFANAASPWLTVSLIFGLLASSRWSAGIGGVAIQILGLICYSEVSKMRFGMGMNSHAIMTWGAGGLLFGSLLAVGAFYLKHSLAQSHSRQITLYTPALLGALYAAEGSFHVYTLHDPTGYLFVGIGAVIALLLPWHRALKEIALGAAVFMVLSGIGGFGFNIILPRLL